MHAHTILEIWQLKAVWEMRIGALTAPCGSPLVFAPPPPRGNVLAARRNWLLIKNPALPVVRDLGGRLAPLCARAPRAVKNTNARGAGTTSAAPPLWASPASRSTRLCLRRLPRGRTPYPPLPASLPLPASRCPDNRVRTFPEKEA
ncbi:hypothetical protein NDU88_004592 [Pleurodeles waltl]|uniref:Uncharacterized protein n=1 Tax=Pleurodeles waltl TaxID=8319 RepID=A0AAV7UFJ8_PLEWA|nr:hypothetical protein NDU88_004592 [Pleurodeles waltl]